MILHHYPNPYFEASRPSIPPLIMLHGLMGSGQNFHTFCKSFAYPTVALDLRNHGLSPHDSIHSYESMAQDVRETLATLSINQCYCLGHSMGGKVAMLFASQFTHLVAGLAVVDMAPTRYVQHQKFYQNLWAKLLSLDTTKMTTKSQAAKQLTDVGNETLVRFLLTNLTPTNSGYQWKINIPAFQKNLATILDFPKISHYPEKVMFLGAKRSDYITDKTTRIIEQCYPNAQIEMVESGHWIHAEQPAIFAAWVAKFVELAPA